MCLLQTPTFNSTMRGRILLDLWTEPDIFGIKWDALTQYNGAVYPALPDLYGPTMNAILSIDSSAYFLLSGTGQARFYPGMPTCPSSYSQMPGYPPPFLPL